METIPQNNIKGYIILHLIQLLLHHFSHTLQLICTFTPVYCATGKNASEHVFMVKTG